MMGFGDGLRMDLGWWEGLERWLNASKGVPFRNIVWLANVPVEWVLGDKPRRQESHRGLMTPPLTSLPSILSLSSPSPSSVSNTVHLTIHHSTIQEANTDAALQLFAIFIMHGSDCPKCGAASDGGKTCSACGAVSTTSAISFMQWHLANIYSIRRAAPSNSETLIASTQADMGYNLLGCWYFILFARQLGGESGGFQLWWMLFGFNYLL